MKWSKYNFLFKSDRYGYMVFNSITNGFASIEPEIYTLFQELMKGSKTINEIDNELKSQLIDASILVESDEIEFLKLKHIKQSIRHNKDWLGLTIAPTLHCNFNCIYCFEKSRPNIYMTDEVENALIDFVKLKNPPKGLHITWYGGEPLMDFKRIRSITKRIKDLDFKINAKIISNGYLISEEIVNQFEELDINNIQITLDGKKEIHDTRRTLLDGRGTFDRIIENIGYLVNNTNDKFRIDIRVNIDKSNEDNYHELFAYLHKKFTSKKIYIYPGFVTEDSGSCSSADSCYLDRHQKASFKINLYKKYGIAHDRTFFPMVSHSECMARSVNCFLIDPKGNIYKCWKDINVSKKVIGSILDNSLNENLLVKYLSGADPLENKDCKTCFHLALCGGGCTYYRLENEFYDGNFDLCYDAKDRLSEYLELHAEIKDKVK